MNVLAISDTHGNHLDFSSSHFDNIDILIHAGDSTNYFDLLNNEIEFNKFISWYAELPVKHKVLVPGNHDAWATRKYNRDKVKDFGITYLEHEYTEIEDLRIFGSPYTPTFNNWYFMKSREKLGRYWDYLETDIDILITHGPPKGILDQSHDDAGILEHCGDGALLKKILKVKPKVHVFGHIHNSSGCFNSGLLRLNGISTDFYNVSCVTDGKFSKGLSSFGSKLSAYVW